MTDETTERPEPMAGFFDLRADGYDDHIRGYVFTESQFLAFYEAVVTPIPVTEAPLTILDLGCGTGLEIEALLRRAPHARITGVDLSTKMLEKLQRRYSDHMDQITLIADSYLTLDFPAHSYDYVISAMTLHHLRHDAKRSLYKKIRAALNPGGCYVEGDAVTLPESEGQFLAEYSAQIAATPSTDDGYYHIDLPFSIETQKTLLLEAGFRDFELLWQKDSSVLWNAAVYAVTA